MGLTVNAIINGVNSAYPLGHGLQYRTVDVTIGDASVDYSSGINIGSLKATMGLGAIICVLGMSLRDSSNVPKKLLLTWDAVNEKVMISENAAAIGEFPEATLDTDVEDGDILRIALIGAGP